MITRTGSVGGGLQERVDWGNRTGTGEGVGTGTTTVSEPDETLVLKRQYFGKDVKSSANIPDPAPGFMIWLEPR
jgi:hypothetical protein